MAVTRPAKTAYRWAASGKSPQWALVVWAFCGLLIWAVPSLALDTSKLPLETIQLPGPAGLDQPQAWSLVSDSARLDPRQNPVGAVLQNTGTALSLSPWQGTTWTSGIYYSKRVGYLEATRDRFSLASSYEAAMPFAPRLGGVEQPLERGRAVHQKLDYQGGRWAVRGLYQDVDRSFQALSSLTEKDPLAKQLQAARGLKQTELGTTYTAKGMSLTADYGSLTSALGKSPTRASYQKFDGKLGRLALTGNLSEVDLGFQAAKEQIQGNERVKTLWGLRGLDIRQYGMSYQLGGGMSLATEFSDITSLHGGKNKATYQKFEGKFGKLALAASVLDVDRSFTAAKDQVEGNAQIKALAASRGIRNEQFSFSYTAGPRFALASSRNQVTNDQPGHKEAGITRTETRHELKAKLSGATDLGITQGTLRLTSNGTGQVMTDTTTSTLSLAHKFSRAFSAGIMRELVDNTKEGKQVSSDLTALHAEYRPGQALALVMDTRDKSYSNGVKESLRQLNFDTALGQGRGRFALKGEVKQATSGPGGSQQERANKLSLTAGGSPLLGMALQWQTLEQHGPLAERDYGKLAGKVTSQLGLAQLSASFNNETEMRLRSRLDRNYKLEMAPKLFSLALGQDLLQVRNQPGAVTDYSALLWKFGRPLAPWAKDLSAGGPSADLYRYGFARMPAWALIPESGIQYSLINRQVEGKPEVETEFLGYNRMLGGQAYLRYAKQDNPVDDKGNVIPVARTIYELGTRLGGRGSLVARSLSERNDANKQAADTTTIIARTEVGRQLSLAAGEQTTQVSTGARTDLRYGGLAWKVTRPLDKWALEASECGVVALFPDALTYGYRKLPAWRLLPEQGLYYQLTSRSNEKGDAVDTRIIGYQAMVGRRAYLKLSLQSNPLDEKNNLLLAERRLYEMGGRLAGKVTLLGRLVNEEGISTGSTSRMFALFGQLSSKEKLSTVVIFDRAHFPGASYQGTTYGLEYSRELDADHYLVLKAVTSENGKPGLPQGEARCYRVDVAFKKDL